MTTDKTALITGASSGLGEAFARRLAAEGYHLILTARRSNRLAALADELTRQHGVACQVIAADLAQEEQLARLESLVAQGPPLSLLINNAGFGIKNRFSDGDLSKHLAMIQLHVTAAVRLTHAALPAMLARRQGAVINVASMAAFVPFHSTTYAATKAYLVAFSEGLASEVMPAGVTVQALCPGFFYSEFHETPEMTGFKRSVIPSLLWLKPEAIVHESLRALERRRVICIPGVQYKLIAVFAQSPLTRSLIAHFARARFFRKF